MGASLDDGKLLDLYKELRVADVRDGMDWNSMHHFGSMSTDIRPLFRTLAVEVARYAAQELASDKVVRRKLYEEAGLAPDDTVS
jgi:rhodanese-related sulfurtransferase